VLLLQPLPRHHVVEHRQRFLPPALPPAFGGEGRVGRRGGRRRRDVAAAGGGGGGGRRRSREL
jgi:hypothetical protein